MTRWLFAAIVALPMFVGAPLRSTPFCVGALAAQITQAQERTLPPGEWCQRPAQRMDRKAHACTCHKHDCADEDPTHVSAHTDPQCLSYCTVTACRCLSMDCP